MSTPPPPISLRDRLVGGVLLSTAAVLAALGFAVYGGVRHRLEQEFDRSLEALAHSSSAALVAEHVRLQRPEPFAPSLRPLSPLAALLERQDLLVQGWRDGDTEIARSEHLTEGKDLPRLEAPLDVAVMEAATLEDGTTVRVATLSHRPPPPPRHARRPRPGRPDRPDPPVEPPILTVSVARSDAPVRAALAHLRLVLLLTGTGALLAGAFLLTVVVRRSLRPLGRLGEEIARLDDTRLDHRIQVDGAPAELLPVVDRLNESLARLGRAFERERSFAASAAHELRTPLAGLRATLEVSVDRERPPAEHLEAERTCLDIVLRMEALLEGLLELARTDAPATRAVPCLLGPVIDDALAAAAPLLEGRHLTVESAGADINVLADERLLRRLVGNVVTNAATYADEGSVVAVEWAREGDDVLLTVANRTTGLPADAGARAFETFWRADAARESSDHVGLGLPLCRRIATRLSGAIDATSVAERFVVTVRLPSAGDAAEGFDPPT